jgi:hypothetical protein
LWENSGWDAPFEDEDEDDDDDDDDETFILLSGFIPLSIVGAVVSAKVAYGIISRFCEQSSCGLFSIDISVNTNFIIIIASTNRRLIVA